VGCRYEWIERDVVPMSPRRKAAQESAKENQKKQAKVMDEARAKNADGGPIVLDRANTITTVIIKAAKNLDGNLLLGYVRFFK
jgi:hypothetical protein